MSAALRKLGGGLPRSYLRPCLLLLLAESPAHGYDLLEHIGGLGLEGADAGGLYRCLRALEHEGLVRSWWEDSACGPARRRYALTGEGHERLHTWATALRETHRTVGRYLERYTALEATGLREGA